MRPNRDRLRLRPIHFTLIYLMSLREAILLTGRPDAAECAHLEDVDGLAFSFVVVVVRDEFGLLGNYAALLVAAALLLLIQPVLTTIQDLLL